MKKKMCALLALVLCLSGCAGERKGEAGGPGIFTTVVTYTGEDDDARYLEVSRQGWKLVELLEEQVGAFVMDAYNFQEIGDHGELLYTFNDLLGYLLEIAPTARPSG